jgi:pilus assembly protein Flp/PilA
LALLGKVSGQAFPPRQTEIEERSMINKLKAFGRDESGASAAEYALILGIIGTTIAVASVTLGNAIGSVMTRAAGRMATILP